MCTLINVIVDMLLQHISQKSVQFSTICCLDHIVSYLQIFPFLCKTQNRTKTNRTCPTGLVSANTKDLKFLISPYHYHHSKYDNDYHCRLHLRLHFDKFNYILFRANPCHNICKFQSHQEVSVV